MNSRILPPEEWPRLEGTEAENVWPKLNPQSARILVVEEDGEIVATWTLLTVVHAECLWIAPEYRGSFGVTKRLLSGLREVASEWDVSKVITGSVSPHVTDLIMRLGGKSVPGQSFILPVSGTRKSRSENSEREAGHEILPVL
jgi:N-acetylglutamate synthase-like GNAT family acetyltransferase